MLLSLLLLLLIWCVTFQTNNRTVIHPYQLHTPATISVILRRGVASQLRV